MLVHLRAAVLISLLSCLASAYSTQFLTEGVGEEGRTPMAEVTKTQKTEKNDPSKKHDNDLGIEVKVIPIVTDVFSQAEDLFNMTPLKLVAAISAQHLITTVNNMPIAGNSYIDSLNMLEGIVDEFNKTAQIIKLTAKYVNISGHYILSILKEFTEQSCEVKSLDQDLKSVRKNFLKTITDHVIGVIKELNEKTRQREMTGSDILVTSSYHIVSAFQEMTNQVLSLAAESKAKCKSPLTNTNITPLSGEKQFSEQKDNNVLTFEPILNQGKTHKSIKKDQAQPKTEGDATQTVFRLSENRGSLNSRDDDLTVETDSPQPVLNINNYRLPNKNQLKVPQEVADKYTPIQKISLFKNPKSEITNKLETSENEAPKYDNNQFQRVKIFPPEGIKENGGQLLHTNTKEVPSDDITMENLPQNKLFLFNPKNQMPAVTPKEDETDLKISQKSKVYDKELDSGAVDSLSNVPWSSNESQDRGFNKGLLMRPATKKQLSPKDEINIVDLFESQHQDEQKQKQCGELLEPVCCFDENSKKFIIFLNDCKREEHNRAYQSSYTPTKMETCVGLFLRNPTLFAHPLGSRDASTKNVDLKPR